MAQDATQLRQDLANHLAAVAEETATALALPVAEFDTGTLGSDLAYATELLTQLERAISAREGTPGDEG